jgi:hypothetical protein
MLEDRHLHCFAGISGWHRRSMARGGLLCSAPPRKEPPRFFPGSGASGAIVMRPTVVQLVVPVQQANVPFLEVKA